MQLKWNNYPFCGKVMWGSENSSTCRGMQGIKILIEAPRKRFPYIPFAHLNNGLGQSMGNLHSGTIDHCQGHHVLVRTVVLLAMSHHIRNRFKPLDLYIHVDVYGGSFHLAVWVKQVDQWLQTDKTTLTQTTQTPRKHGTCHCAFESKCALETIIGKS